MVFRHAFLAAVGVASLYAASDETHQLWVYGRDATVRDWLAGSLGAIGGAGLYAAAVRFAATRRSGGGRRSVLPD
jgi:VanZ family protein